MPQALLEEEIILGSESAGLLMTAEEFDGIREYDENFRYELIHGVVVVSPIPLPEETNPNERLGAAWFVTQEGTSARKHTGRQFAAAICADQQRPAPG